MDEPKKKILIIEDEPPMIKALEEVLTNANFITITATNGENGIKAALEDHPDLIILDILMPKLSGAQVMEKLRADDWGKTVPIILLTNVSPDSDAAINTVVKDQPAYYLIKSDVTLAEVVDKTKEVLKAG